MKRPDDGEKVKEAVAIRYDAENESAPRVVAKGRGLIAEQITEAARQHAIPLYQNKTLASALMAIELNSEIPLELYSAVAEVLAYIYRLDQSIKHKT